MNTRFLAALCAIADAGSLAAAARTTNLSSSTLAEQVQALEHELGVRLVARRGRALAITDEGRAVVEAGREILARVADLGQLALLGRVRGKLRVGAISTALISIVPPALERMATRHPGVSLKIVPGTSSQLFQMLDAGTIDCAVTVAPPFALAKEFGWRLVRREVLTLLTPLSLERGSLPDYFAAAPMIRMDRASATGQIVTAFLNDRRIDAVNLFEMDAPSAITILVAKGLGISLLHDYGFASTEILPLRTLAIADPAYARHIGVLYRRGSRDALVEALWASLGDDGGTSWGPSPGLTSDGESEATLARAVRAPE